MPFSKSLARSLLVGATALLVHPGLGRADEARLMLAWSAPSGCPSGDQIETAVLALLGQDRVFASSLRAGARIDRAADGRYTLDLHTVQSGIVGERTLSGNSCIAVSDAAIVTIALSIDPNLELPSDLRHRQRTASSANNDVTATPKTNSESSAEAAPARSAPSSSAEAAPARSAPSSSSSSSPTPTPRSSSPALPSPTTVLFLRSHVGWRWGALPESVGEAGLGLGVERAWASMQAELSFSPRATAHSHTEPNAGGSFSMRYGGLAACAVPFELRLRVSPCVGVGYTQLAAEGFGVAPQRRGSLSWVSILTGLTARYALSKPVALLLSAEVQLALRQPEAFLLLGSNPSESETLFRPERVAYQARAGAEFRIW